MLIWITVKQLHLLHCGGAMADEAKHFGAEVGQAVVGAAIEGTGRSRGGHLRMRTTPQMVSGCRRGRRRCRQSH